MLCYDTFTALIIPLPALLAKMSAHSQQARALDPYIRALDPHMREEKK